MRDRYVQERRQQQMQSCDSGMGTSVGDSESEAESLSEHVRQGEEEGVSPRNASGNNSSEDGEERIYNYGAECDEEPEDSSSSEGESEKEEDDFMKDRQTDEDYSAYRERIFDFTPKGYKQKKSLVEEINDEETPTTSGVSEVPTTSNNKEIEVEKRQIRNEDAFNFQKMIQHMSKAERIDVSVEETKDKADTEETSMTENSDGDEIRNTQDNTNSQQQEDTDEESTDKEGSYLERQRKILVSQATERVRKLEMSSMTFEEYMTSRDKSTAKENNPATNTEENKKEVPENGCDMAKNTVKENVTKENKTLKDIMKENNVINGESDSDDSSEDEERNASTVSERGDGPPLCPLREPKDIKEALAVVLKSYSVQNDEEDGSRNNEMIRENINKPESVEISNTVQGVFENISNTPETKDSNSNEAEKGSSEVTNDEKQSEDGTITKSNCDSEESDDESSDEGEKPYYRKLDISVSTAVKQTDETADEINTVKSKEEIKEELIDNCQTKQEEEQQDVDYREMLKWDLKVPDQNVQILLPIQRKKPEEDFKDELCDLLIQTKASDKPEFEITPPKDIVEENDTILYPRNTTESICSTSSYKSIYTQTGRKAEVKPPLVHKVLKLSQNYPIFQKSQNEVIKNEIEEEHNTPETSLVVCNKISEVRDQMAQFTKNLEEFNERSRKAREEIIKDYNSAVERELKIVDKLMAMRKNMFDKKYTKPTFDAMKTRKVDYIDNNVMRKHFEDLGIILEEDSDSEEELKAAIERINKKLLKDMGIDSFRSNEAGEGAVLRKVIIDGNDEEEKKDMSKESNEMLINDESYEECMTTNEEDEENNEGKNDVKEKSNESNEEYFTTNEEDSEEYYETNNVEQEDISEEESRNYQQFIRKLRKEIQEDANDDDESEDENFKESAASQYDEKETDDKATVDIEDLQKCGQCPAIKRHVNCSLEMQLAKKAEED